MAGPLDHARVTEPKNPEMTPEQELKKTRIRLKKNIKMADQTKKKSTNAFVNISSKDVPTRSKRTRSKASPRLFSRRESYTKRGIPIGEKITCNVLVTFIFFFATFLS